MSSVSTSQDLGSQVDHPAKMNIHSCCDESTTAVLKLVPAIFWISLTCSSRFSCVCVCVVVVVVKNLGDCSVPSILM